MSLDTCRRGSREVDAPPRDDPITCAAACATAKRLALLVAASLWDNEEFHADVYERHVGEDGPPCPKVGLVEPTEDGRLEILADGREYVLRVECKTR